MIDFLLLLLTIILQIAFVNIFSFSPNLVFIFLSLYFLRVFSPQANQLPAGNLFLIYVAVAGLILDFFSGLPFGIIAISFILTFLLLSFLRQFVFIGHINLLIIGIFIFVATLVYNILLSSFGSMFGHIINPQVFFLKVVPTEIIYNILFAIVIFYVLQRFKKIFY